MVERKNHNNRASLKTDKPVLYIDMDGVLCDFDTRHQELLDRGVPKWKCFDHPEAYTDLTPLEGAIDAFHQLEKKYDVYILSTAAWNNIDSWKDKYLIDDRIANGVADFTGKHIHFGTEEFPTWKETLEFLL